MNKTNQFSRLSCPTTFIDSGNLSMAAPAKDDDDGERGLDGGDAEVELQRSASVASQ